MPAPLSLMMKKTLPSLAGAFLLAAAPAFAAPLAADSRITAVTVYADRAVVTRHATLDVAAGPVELSLAQLPAALLDVEVRFARRHVDIAASGGGENGAGGGRCQVQALGFHMLSLYLDSTVSDSVMIDICDSASYAFTHDIQ